MKRGRPANADTPYKIIVHKNGGYEYAATKITKTGKDGKTEYEYKHWGRLLEGKKFHPNSTYLYEPTANRDKLKFPADWDLSEVERLSRQGKRGRVAYEEGDVDRQYGPTWFLTEVARRVGLLDDLREVFDGNMQMVNDVLTLAFFPFIDNLSYNHLEQWQREVKALAEHPLTAPVITRLSQSITEQHKMKLFHLRASRIGKDELCAVDSTSISTYGFNLSDIRWGKNKERLPLQQVMELVVYSLTSHMPIFYKELPGNIPDSRTTEEALTELEHAGFRNLVLVTDRGYESLKNFELFVSKGLKVITCVKVGQKEVLDKIASIDMSLGYPKGMTISKDDDLFYKQFDMEYTVKGNGEHEIKAEKYKLNLYLDLRKRDTAICDIHHAVLNQSEEAKRLIDSAEAVPDTDALKRSLNYLTLTFGKENTLTEATVNQDKVDKHLMTAGFFANKTLRLDLDAAQAMDTYGMRDEQEKAFGLQKGPLCQDRMHVWTEASKHGRMFICFVGLILASYVRSIWQGKPELRKRFKSTEALLAEMRTIRCIEHDGHKKFITPFVGAQIDICNAFGFEIPSECAPKYISKKRPTGKKRGRPAKAKTETQEI